MEMIEREVSSFFAPINGETTAIAEAPQTESPVESRREKDLLIPKKLLIRYVKVKVNINITGTARRWDIFSVVRVSWVP